MDHCADNVPEATFNVTYPGPFEHHDVVVNGWRLPLLEAQLAGDGAKVLLVLDRRFSLELTVEEAERIVPFLADTLAVALGYDAHPNETDPLPLSRAPHPKPQRTVAIAGLFPGPAD